MGCSTKLQVNESDKAEMKAFFTGAKMPEYQRSMPKHTRQHPERDYSVNRVERRKRNKKKGRVRN